MSRKVENENELEEEFILEEINMEMLSSRQCQKLWQETKVLWQLSLSMRNLVSKRKGKRPIAGLRIEYGNRGSTKAIVYDFDLPATGIAGDQVSARLTMEYNAPHRSTAYTLATGVDKADQNELIFRYNRETISLKYAPGGSRKHYTIAGHLQKTVPSSLRWSERGFPESFEAMTQIKRGIDWLRPALETLNADLTKKIIEPAKPKAARRIQTTPRLPSQPVAPFDMYRLIE